MDVTRTVPGTKMNMILSPMPSIKVFVWLLVLLFWVVVVVVLFFSFYFQQSVYVLFLLYIMMLEGWELWR